MSDLVGNPEDWFSHNEAHIIVHSDMLSFKKKNAGQGATTSFHSSFLHAHCVIFAAMHKEKIEVQGNVKGNSIKQC